MNVLIPSPLRSYTKGRSEVQADGDSLGQLLQDLDARHPGIRFRMIDEQDEIRPHIRIFINTERATSLRDSLHAGDEVMIVAALSGG